MVSAILACLCFQTPDALLQGSHLFIFLCHLAGNDFLKMKRLKAHKSAPSNVFPKHFPAFFFSCSICPSICFRWLHPAALTNAAKNMALKFKDPRTSSPVSVMASRSIGVKSQLVEPKHLRFSAILQVVIHNPTGQWQQYSANLTTLCHFKQTSWQMLAVCCTCSRSSCCGSKKRLRHTII